MSAEQPRPNGGGLGDVRLPWSRSERRLPRLVVRPLQRFLATETAGGILLMIAAIAALVWANSPWSGSYARLWHTELRIDLGSWSLSHDLRGWVNEGLMTIFFFVVGLEIKREVLTGELRDPRAAALPVIGALGGMILPALLFLAATAGTPGSRGWAIPVATDIAFAVGVLALAGRRAPAAMKLFLLALAIVDDIGAIVVIALFYGGGVGWTPLAAAAGLVGVMVAAHRVHVRATAVYAMLGFGVWLAFLGSGVHATIAGVLLGLLAPASPFQRPRAVSDEAVRVAEETVDDPSPPDADAHHWLWLTRLSREAVSPLGRYEHLLHPWTSFVVVPVFALANAGVRLTGGLGGGATARVAIGVVLGLVVGKLVGITLACRIGVAARVARLPDSAGFRELRGVSAVAGIGFTVSLFVAQLAFPEGSLLRAAKLGIIVGSTAAGALGMALIRMTKPRNAA